MGTIAPLPQESKSVFAEFPGLVMRHKAIEVVCAHVKDAYINGCYIL